MSAHQQLLYHIVFSTQNVLRWLTDGLRETIFAYMAGTAKDLDGFAIKVGGFYDHAHLLVRIPARIAVSDFVGQLKATQVSTSMTTTGRSANLDGNTDSAPLRLAYQPKTLWLLILKNRWITIRRIPSKMSIC